MLPVIRRARFTVVLAAVSVLTGVSLSEAVPETRNGTRAFQNSMDGEWVGNGISYGPHRDGQYPGRDEPTRAQISEDLLIMREHWRMLRMYATGNASQHVLEIIRERALGMKVILGAWIDPESGAGALEAIEANRRQVNLAIKLANKYPDIVVAVSVGNETQVSWSSHRVAPEVLIGYLREVRSRTKVPVTTADDYTFWLEPRARPVADEADFIFTHIYAMWRGRQLDDAVAFTRSQFAAVQSAYPGRQVVIGEAGWATKKHGEGDQAKYIKGRPGEVEQDQFLKEYLGWTTQARVTNFYFEAFDEKWKGGAHPDEVEKHWGLYNSDRTPKLAARNRLGCVSGEWQKRVRGISWICYNPSNSDPPRNKYADLSGIRADLVALRSVGFTGLVTYACGPPVLHEVVKLAKELGFSGVILGIWDPTSGEECDLARKLAESDIVLGLCAGNEGLGRRYSYEQLVVAVDRLRTATGKPVATTEEIDDYIEPRVLHLGDWVFPNTHPVYHARNTVDAGVSWTVGAYEDMRRRTDQFVWFKEVGWPSGGGDDFTRGAQQSYYEQLAEREVTFAYFEGFDQPWKKWRACEAHFGLFDSERQPKPLAAKFIKGAPSTLRYRAEIPEPKQSAAPRRKPLCVYREHGFSEHHFTPTGRQGDSGDVYADENWRENVHAGESCLRVRLDVAGAGPNECDYGPPCRWGGLRWLHPAHNWGRTDDSAGLGLDLTGYRRVVFWARAEKRCTLSFLVGGVDSRHGDSLTFPARAVHRVDQQWRQYSVDLTGCDLSHIIAGFGVTSSWDTNPEGVTLFLDDIYYE